MVRGASLGGDATRTSRAAHPLVALQFAIPPTVQQNLPTLRPQIQLLIDSLSRVARPDWYGSTGQPNEAQTPKLGPKSTD